MKIKSFQTNSINTMMPFGTFVGTRSRVFNPVVVETKALRLS